MTFMTAAMDQLEQAYLEECELPMTALSPAEESLRAVKEAATQVRILPAVTKRSDENPD